MKWIHVKGFNEIITIEGFAFANPGDDVFGFSNSFINLREFGVQPINQAVISGVNASLMKNALSDNIPWTTILIPTRVFSGIDYKGAVSAVQILSKMCNLDISTEHLEHARA
jgi:predicted ATP-grasp superfamily ATP-dependent carboligase